MILIHNVNSIQIVQVSAVTPIQTSSPSFHKIGVCLGTHTAVRTLTVRGYRAATISVVISDCECTSTFIRCDATANPALLIRILNHDDVK